MQTNYNYNLPIPTDDENNESCENIKDFDCVVVDEEQKFFEFWFLWEICVDRPLASIDEQVYKHIDATQQDAEHGDTEEFSKPKNEPETKQNIGPFSMTSWKFMNGLESF